MSTFRHLESIGQLDQDQDLHIICLHYVFLSRLNWHLKEFIQMWDRHPLSTEGNRSPQQLWIAGLLSGQQENPDQVTLWLGVPFKVQFFVDKIYYLVQYLNYVSTDWCHKLGHWLGWTCCRTRLRGCWGSSNSSGFASNSRGAFKGQHWPLYEQWRLWCGHLLTSPVIGPVLNGYPNMKICTARPSSMAKVRKDVYLLSMFYSIGWHARVLSAKVKVHRHCFPAARVIDVVHRSPQSWRMTLLLHTTMCTTIIFKWEKI